MKGQMRVGAGRAEVVFPEAYFPQETFWGVRDALHARAILIEQCVDEDFGAAAPQTAEEEGGAEQLLRFLLISMELPSIRPFDMIDDLRREAAALTGVPYENIWLCMTHDLSSPHVPPKAQLPEKFAMHMKAVRDAIQEACLQAVNSLRPARLGVGTGISLVGANRDVQTNQGWVMGIKGSQPVDPGLTVVRFETPEGEPIAFLYQYAIKSSVIEDSVMPDGIKKASCEVSGRACMTLEEANGGAPAIFLMGAAGDQVPRQKARYWEADENGDAVVVDHGAAGYEMLDHLSAELGEDLLRTAGGITCTEEETQLELRHLIWTYPGQGDYRGPKVGGGPIQPYAYTGAGPEELKVEVLRLGKAVFLGLQPESTATIGLQLKAKAAQLTDRLPLMVAMVNGGKGYLADEASYDHYTHAGTSSVFARGSAEQFVGQAAQLTASL